MHSNQNQTARFNAVIYAISQAFNGSSAAVNISLGGLVGSYLLSADKSLATAPVTGYNIGVALGAVPAAILTRYLGRRYGFIAGLCTGIAGLLLSAYALFLQSFVIFCVGMIISGVSGGFGQQYRFAAADQGDEKTRAKSISWVLTGGVASAIIGPQIVIFTRDLLLPVQFVGAYLSVAVMVLLAMIAMTFLKPTETPAQTAKLQVAKPRPLIEIASQPKFLIALLCGTVSYALMSLTMTAAPLAMVGCGISVDNAALGIQWHVIAMFAPSFITGQLIARFGKTTIIALGMIILIGCALVALSGLELWKFWTALVLLGLGWNFGFIGSTALVTETYLPHEKNKVQGLNDFVVFGSVALSSLTAGYVLNAYGWEMISYLMIPPILIALASLTWLLMYDVRKRRLTSQ